MTRHIVLDSPPLGVLSNPAKTAATDAMNKWVQECVVAGHRLYVPEVIDYELRRELVRSGSTKSIARLNSFKLTLNYVPLTTDAMLLAADLWAQSRNAGQPTGDPKKLDIDVILAAQALTLGVPAQSLVVVTTNVAHLSRFVTADLWQNITPQDLPNSNAG